MTLLQILILSVIEGVTEFLPVSSTGHLILATKLLNVTAAPFVTSFTIAIQLGAIMAVLILYGRQLAVNRRLALLAVAGFVPTGAIGLALYSLIVKKLLSSPMVVVWALIGGGLVLILFEYWYGRRFAGATTKSLGDLTVKDALLIGLIQSVSVVPGVSRSAATIVAGLVRGFSREAIVAFSFLLAVPTMAAATGYDLFKNGFVFTNGQWLTLVGGAIISCAVAAATIRWLVRFVATNSFIVFGVYRIIIGLIFLFIFTGIF